MALENSDLLPLYRIADQSNRKISVADFSTFISSEAGKLAKPGREGTFFIVEDVNGVVSYTEDTSLKPGDDVSELNNDANYLASGDDISELNNDAGYLVTSDLPDLTTLSYVPLGSWSGIPAV